MTMVSRRNLLHALAVVALASWAACDQPQVPGTQAIVIPGTAAEGGAQTVARPTLVFQDTLHAFGTISEGHEVTHRFSFRNNGPGQALIADVSTTCGCTVPKTWPRHALAPGEEGVVEGAFGVRCDVDASAVFLTSQGLRTPLHSDPEASILVHVQGKKRVLAIPPSQSDASPKRLAELLPKRLAERVAELLRGCEQMALRPHLLRRSLELIERGRVDALEERGRAELRGVYDKCAANRPSISTVRIHTRIHIHINMKMSTNTLAYTHAYVRTYIDT